VNPFAAGERGEKPGEDDQADPRIGASTSLRKRPDADRLTPLKPKTA
jgi:hypothetical protein